MTGCASARLFAENNHDVTVLEQRSHIAGNCFDQKEACGITVHRYGPHLFHTSDTGVRDFVCRFAAFRPYEHRVLSSVNGILYPFPLNLKSLSLFFGETLDEKSASRLLQHEINQANFCLPPADYRDAMLSRIGEKLYNAFFKNYARKQWQRDPASLSPALADRIPLRLNCDDRYFTDSFQGVPVQGYTRLCKEMLHHRGIRISLRDRFQRGMEKDYDFLIYTGRLDEFFSFVHGKLDYRSVRVEFETLPCRQYQEAAVINYPNEYEFTRITEYKRISGEKSEQTIISREYPDSHGIAAYIVPEPLMLERRERYLEMARALEKKGQACFLGRLAEYRYYNMDQVIAGALRRFCD